jgi:uncharacterized cupredoxin-like copper-binding protein
MITKNRYYYLLTALALGTLFLAACGSEPADSSDMLADEHEEGGEEDGDDHEMGAESFEDAETITIIATEFGYEPASIELHAGEPVNIMLVNEGLIEHDLQIVALDFHVHALPGETAMAGFIPEESGTFEFACLIAGHLEAGMVGELNVE